MVSTNVTPMGGSISNGDASLLISASRLGLFDKSCELVLEGNPDTLKPLSTADPGSFYHAIAQNKDGIAVLYEARIVRWMKMHFIKFWKYCVIWKKMPWN